jgi:hypothetical protein
VSGGAARLGIDFGTSSTVAVIAVDDRPPRPLLFDGSPLLPSAVCYDPTGRMLVGRDAVQLAAAAPAGFEPHPKRCVDEGTVLLAGRPIAVEAMFTAVFGRVVEQAARFGDGPGAVTVTHPAGWGAARISVLARSAPPGSRLVPEPVAAAHYFVDVAGHRLPDDGTALVYDLGAGTFDASLVRRTGAGFAVVATTGLPDAGGLDIDAAIVEYLRATVGGEETWAAITAGDDPAAGRARRELWDNVRGAKEVLSRLTTTLIHLPLFDVDVPLGREQLDRLAAPVLDRTVRATRDLLATAGDRPAAVFLAGGASRMPAVATALHRALGITPSMVDEPELAVAEGSLRVPPPGASSGPPPAGVHTDASWPAATPLGVTPNPVRRRRRVAVGAAAALVLLLITGTAVWTNLRDGGDDPASGSRPDANTARGAPLTSPGAASSPTASPSPSHRPGIDPCLLGTWRQESGLLIGYIDDAPVQYVGGNGTVRTFNRDGVMVINYDASTKQAARWRGVRWEMLHRGTITARYLADGKTVRWRSGTADGRTRLYRNGRLVTNEKMSVLMEPSGYACSDTHLSWTSSRDTYSSEWVRVSPPAA